MNKKFTTSDFILLIVSVLWLTKMNYAKMSTMDIIGLILIAAWAILSIYKLFKVR